MKKVNILLLLAVLVTGFGFGFIAPDEAAAYKKPTIPEPYCFVVYSPPCVLRCCTIGGDYVCEALQCW